MIYQSWLTLSENAYGGDIFILSEFYQSFSMSSGRIVDKPDITQYSISFGSPVPNL